MAKVCNVHIDKSVVNRGLTGYKATCLLGRKYHSPKAPDLPRPDVEAKVKSANAVIPKVLSENCQRQKKDHTRSIADFFHTSRADTDI